MERYWLRRWGVWMYELWSGGLRPCTMEQRRFVQAADCSIDSSTFAEALWRKVIEEMRSMGVADFMIGEEEEEDCDDLWDQYDAPTVDDEPPVPEEEWPTYNHDFDAVDERLDHG